MRSLGGRVRLDERFEKLIGACRKIVFGSPLALSSRANSRPCSSRMSLLLLALLVPELLRAQPVTSELSWGPIVEANDGLLEAPLILSSPDDVQGVVAVAEWDAGVAEGVEFTPGSAFDIGDGADTVVLRVEDGFFVLASVFDSDPQDNGGVPEVIVAGRDIELGRLRLRCVAAAPAEVRTTALTFVDDRHAATDGGPELENVLAVRGISVGVDDGLVLGSRELICGATRDRFEIESATIEVSECGGSIVSGEGRAHVLLDNALDVQGFVTSICHDPAALELVTVDIGRDATQADFSNLEIAENGAALAVIIDLVDPTPEPLDIPAGSNRHVASYVYRCRVLPPVGGSSSALEFCDGVIGDPSEDNVIVVAGGSIGAADGLELVDGFVRCVRGNAGGEPERGLLCSDGIDNDCDGLIDANEPDCREFDFEVIDPETLEPTVVEAPVGSLGRAVIGYRAPTLDRLGIPVPPGGNGSRRVSAQGFSLGFSFDCAAVRVGESLDITDTILDALEVDFVAVQADNSGDDGDGCSLVISVLVDSVPPFEGGVIPGLSARQPVGAIEVGLREGTECGSEHEIIAEDGVNGTGRVPVFNLIAVDNLPYSAAVRPIAIRAVEVERFFRGDCNFTRRSRGLDPVEIADAAAVISFLFRTGIFRFDPPCVDACDSNDDGRVDLADALAILEFLFVPGSEFLPAPGPGFDLSIQRIGPGVDPTPDPLDCAAGSDCDA
jgi:hypothetical protein